MIGTGPFGPIAVLFCKVPTAGAATVPGGMTVPLGRNDPGGAVASGGSVAPFGDAVPVAAVEPVTAPVCAVLPCAPAAGLVAGLEVVG